jgi:protein-tyrosine kinase
MEPGLVKKLKLQPPRSPAVDEVPGPSAASADQLWAAIERAEVDPRRARRNRIVTFARNEPEHASFDVLRTKLLRSLKLNNWTAVAITSPEPGCGKSVVAVNLAFSMANVKNCRVVLLDLDFRRPRIGAMLGLNTARPTAAFLDGKNSIERSFVRYGDNLAVSAGSDGVHLPAELLQSQPARAAMIEVRKRLSPDVILLDLPPVLGSDDVLAFLPNVDCALLVVGAGTTSITQVRRSERELSRDTNLLGMVLNKCRHEQDRGYY